MLESERPLSRQPHPFVTRGLWLSLAVSSIIVIEPSPYDFVLLTTCVISFFAFKLRIPHSLGLPLALLGLYLIANLVAAMIAGTLEATFKPLSIRIYLVVTWIFLASAIAISPTRVLKTLMNGYVVGALVTLAITMLALNNIIFSHDLVLNHGIRVKGTFKDPNLFGPYLVPVGLMVFAGLESGSAGKKLVGFAIFSAVALGVLLSFSRGAWLNFSFAFALFVAIRMVTTKSKVQLKRLLSMSAILLFLAGGVLVTALSSGDFAGYAKTRTSIQSYDTEDHGRFARQRQVIEELGKYPLGVGPGNSALVSGAPHNIFLHIFSEAGILGGLAFLGFIGLTFSRAYAHCFKATTHQALYIAIFVSTVGTLLQSLFIDTTHWRHLYVLLAMLWGPIAGIAIKSGNTAERLEF